MSDSAAPKWAKWKHIPRAAVWEVIVLSCGFEPEYLRDEVERGPPHWRLRTFGISARVPEEYFERLDVVVANLGERIKVLVLDGNDSRLSQISLVEFADFAESCGWRLPVEFPRNTAPAALPVTNPAVPSAAHPLGEALQSTTTDYFDDPYWSMLQVVVWVSTRSREWVSKASDRNRILGRPMTIALLLVILIHRGRTALPDIDAAKQEIVSALSKGEIGARGVDDNEQCVKDIPKDDWSHLELFENGNDGICAKYSAYAGQRLKGKLRYSGLKVKRDAALAEWPRLNREPRAAESKDNVIKFPAGTNYWPVADLPELIAQALSLDGRGNLSAVAKHRAAIVSARESKQLNAVSPTDRLPVVHYQANADVNITDLQNYVEQFGISIQLALPDSDSSEDLSRAYARQDAGRESAGRYTLRQASDELARNAVESADGFVEKFRRAVRAHELAVHRPGEQARYHPETVRDFYEEAYWDDLNVWLESNEPRLQWKFPVPQVAMSDIPGDHDDSHQTTNRPKSQQKHQENEILRVLSQLGCDADALPKGINGKPGVKKKAREKLKFSHSVFDLAWERLLKSKGIKYKT